MDDEFLFCLCLPSVSLSILRLLLYMSLASCFIVIIIIIVIIAVYHTLRRTFFCRAYPILPLSMTACTANPGIETGNTIDI